MKPIREAWFCNIDITSKCFMSCSYCSRYNRHLRDDQRYDMTLEVLEKALDSLKDWPNRIGIIGGEPLLHNQFEDCCRLIQARFPKEKTGIFTSGGKDWEKYKPLVEQTFGFIAYNEHSPLQKKTCRHQRLTVAVKDVIRDKQYMNELIDDCWVQRTWCPTISIKGGFFCEVAGAQDSLWDGPGGYELEPHWWDKTPEQFRDQCERYCQNCGMCLPMERDLLGQGIEKMSPTVYNNMKEHHNIRIETDKNIEIFDKILSINEVEKNKLSWYPGNYRGDNYEDRNSFEGRGSTIFRTPPVNIEVMTMWYNEEFLAPYFLRHYRFANRIHLFLDSDTNDRTLAIIEQERKKHDNIKIHEFKFPDKMNDEIKIKTFNDFYRTMDSDYVFLVDSDEFIFYPAGYLDTYGDLVHFTNLWNVYRHHTETNLTPDRPVREQRTHGVLDYEGWNIYTKANIIKTGLDFTWIAGHHIGKLNGNLVDWTIPHGWLPPGVSRMEPLSGAHWGLADPCFCIERRVKGRRDRQSQYNLTHGLTTQHHHITEEILIASLKQHENDPKVL